MISMISAELHKLIKRKNFLILALLSLWSLVYGLGAFFHWDFVQIGAKLDLITFTTTMWTFLLILTIPLVLILYVSSSILGGEIQGGQILLEVNRVANKKRLITSKYCVALLSIVVLYLLNVLSSFLTYVIFLSRSDFGYRRFWEWHAGNGQSLIISLVNLSFILLLASISYYLSLYFSAVVSAFISFGIYLLCQLLSYITVVSTFIPGYFFIVSDYHFSISLVIIHIVVYIFLCACLVFASMRAFEKKAL